MSASTESMRRVIVRGLSPTAVNRAYLMHYYWPSTSNAPDTCFHERTIMFANNRTPPCAYSSRLQGFVLPSNERYHVFPSPWVLNFDPHDD